MWNRDTGAPFTAIEPENDINQVQIIKKSGMMVMACEEPKMQIYYTPALGPAPRWCSFLDSLTEELEEEATPTVYDDYKFITREELDKLGMTHFIGTNLLRAYMHGFFIDSKLYQKAKAVTDPFSYDKYRKDKIREKIEAQRAKRITVQRKVPKVNAGFAQAVQEKLKKKKTRMNDDGEIEEVEPDDMEKAMDPMSDPRFASMFAEDDFQIDEASEEYKFLHPAAAAAAKKKPPTGVSKHFKPAEDSGDDDEEEKSGPRLYELKKGHTMDLTGQISKGKPVRDPKSKSRSIGERMGQESGLSAKNEMNAAGQAQGGLTWEVDIPEKKAGKKRGSQKVSQKGDSGADMSAAKKKAKTGTKKKR